MSWVLLDGGLVEAIHDEVLNPGELPGRARDNSLDGALARVDNRLAYGMIGDVFDLAAAYAEVIARLCINEANKRAAFRAMNVALAFNGQPIVTDVDEIGPRIVALARGTLEAEELAGWLRGRLAE